MISFVRGILVEFGEGIIVVEAGGIGYEINSSFASISALPSIGDEVIIYTYLKPSEEALTLYGFKTKEELKVFKLLTTVSGVGPKAALAILSTLSLEDLKFAILGGDAKAIAAAPGVGKKTAERVIIDLKDKVDSIESVPGQISTGQVNSSVKQETLMALTALGYSATQAAKALEKVAITENATVDTLLSDALKQMSFL